MSDEQNAVNALESLAARDAFAAGAVAGEIVWILAGLVYFAPEGTAPFQRVVVAAAEFLERLDFHPTGNDIRERWVR